MAIPSGPAENRNTSLFFNETIRNPGYSVLNPQPRGFDQSKKSVMQFHGDNVVQFMLVKSEMAAQHVSGLKLGTPIMSTTGKFIYHISIIDYLQKYDLQKKLERLYKVTVNGANPHEVSTTNVRAYKERFYDFMKDKVFNFDFNHSRLISGYRKGQAQVDNRTVSKRGAQMDFMFNHR